MLLDSPDDEAVVRSMSFAGRRIQYDDTVLEPRPWTQAQSVWGRRLLERAEPGPVLELFSGAGQIGLLAVLGTGRRLVQVDASLTACTWAHRNAREWGVDADIRRAPIDEALSVEERFGVILADPPWVPSDRVAEFPQDPQRAIDGGEDGLDLARTCLAVIASHLTRDGRALLQLGDLDQVLRLEPVIGDHGLRVLEAQSFEPGGVVVLLAPVSPGWATTVSRRARWRSRAVSRSSAN